MRIEGAAGFPSGWTQAGNNKVVRLEQNAKQGWLYTSLEIMNGIFIIGTPWHLINGLHTVSFEQCNIRIRRRWRGDRRQSVMPQRSWQSGSGNYSCSVRGNLAHAQFYHCMKDRPNQDHYKGTRRVDGRMRMGSISS